MSSRDSLDKILERELPSDIYNYSDIPHKLEQAIHQWALDEVKKAEVLVRHEIASNAPPCTHSLQSEQEHKDWCGFVNNIWIHWAVKNKARIVNGEPELLKGDIDES